MCTVGTLSGYLDVGVSLAIVYWRLRVANFGLCSENIRGCIMRPHRVWASVAPTFSFLQSHEIGVTRVALEGEVAMLFLLVIFIAGKTYYSARLFLVVGKEVE